MADLQETVKKRHGKPKGAKMPREDGPGSIRDGSAVSIHGVENSPAAPEQRHSSLPDSVLSLPIKQRAFVQAITDRGNRTFGNKVQSAIAAGYGNSYQISADIGHDLSKKPEIRNAINDMLDDVGLSSKDRTSILSDLAKQRTAEILHYDGDGNLTQRQVVDNGKLRLQAVREASKLAGDYARAESVAKAQRDAVQPLVAHYAKQLREAIKAEERLSLSPHSTPTVAVDESEGTIVVDMATIEQDAATGTQQSVEPTLPESTSRTDGGAGG